MSKDPRFNFYPDNYEGGTEFFTLEEDGAYLRLFMLQFRNHEFTERQAVIKLMQRCPESPERAKVLWEGIKHKFSTNGTHFWSDRLRSEIEKSAENSEKQRINALKRWGKDENGNPIADATADATAKPPHKIGIDSAPPLADAFSSNTNSNKKTNKSSKEKRVGSDQKKMNLVDSIPDTWDRSEFLELWSAFKEMRTKTKSGMTPRSEKLNLTDLKKIAGNDWEIAKGCLEMTIKKSWKGFFAPDKPKPEAKVKSLGQMTPEEQKEYYSEKL